MVYDVTIIGGGVAGMTAAIAVKESHPAANILLIEKNRKLGRKMYATGNGRCNLANTKLDLSSYYSEDEFFPYQIINTKSYMSAVDFINRLGVAVCDEGGYLYPASFQASTVVWAMTDRIRKLKIETHLSEEAASIERLDSENKRTRSGFGREAASEGDGAGADNGALMCGGVCAADGAAVSDKAVVGVKARFRVTTDKGEYKTKNLVLAPGSAAAPKLGGSEQVYSLTNNLNIPIRQPRPALCKLRSRENTESLSGVRARAEVSLLESGRVYDNETGEVQFSGQYLSGIAVFNLSLQCGRLLTEGMKPVIRLSLVPHMALDEVRAWLSDFAKENGNRTPMAMLCGLVNEKLAAFILDRAHISCGLAGEICDEDLSRLADLIKCLDFYIDDLAGYEESQAAAGGVDTKHVRADSMEAENCRGLYIAGEYMDVTGKCGGYNIMWAIMTGMRMRLIP